MSILSEVPRAYEIYLAEVVVQEGSVPDTVKLEVHGGNLLRANSFYLDGKRVENATVEKETYDTCWVTVDRSLFEKEKWYRMELGLHSLGVVDLKSSPIWYQWE